MTPVEAQKYLNSFVNYELKANQQFTKSLKLERVRHLLNLVGNPHQKIRCLHVAGTKGKGSTCAFAAHILESAGFKVGLFTSPHLSDYRERIRILKTSGSHEPEDGFPGKIKEEEFCRLLETIRPSIEATRKKETLGILSFFEIYTTLALCYFYQQQVDFAVLETGLGGRLDATNVVDSLVCGITPISLDHTRQLGTTVAQIAQEKAAIIKNNNQTAVIAPQCEEALAVIKNRCQYIGAKSIFVGKDICYSFLRQDLKEQQFRIKGIGGDYPRLKTKLLGEHQVVNASVAVGMIESLQKLGFVVSSQAVAGGIDDTSWPGRFEIIQKNPFIVLDGAHNPKSCQTLVQTIQKIFPQKKVTLILGISRDKDKIGICAELDKIAYRIIFTKADHPRACDFARIAWQDLFRNKNAQFTKHVQEALNLALRDARSDDVILITGSIFVAGDARKICLNQN